MGRGPVAGHINTSRASVTDGLTMAVDYKNLALVGAVIFFFQRCQCVLKGQALPDALTLHSPHRVHSAWLAIAQS